MSIIVFSILMVAILCNMLLTSFIYTQKRNQPLSQALIVQMLGISGWTIAIAINIYLESMLVEHFIFGFAALFLTAQIWFVMLFPPSRTLTVRGKIALTITTAIGLFFTILSFIPNAVFTKIEVTEQAYTIVEPGTYSGLYALFVFLSILFAIGILGLRYRCTADLTEKKQAKFLLFGFIIFFIINLLTNSLLPVLFSIYFFNAIGPVFSIGLVAFIVYIITQYQFLEIRLIIQRGLIYSIIFSFIILLYATLLNIFSRLPSLNMPAENYVESLIAIVIAIYTVPRLDAYLRKITDPIFFTQRYSYRDVTHTLSKLLQKNLDMDQLVTTCEEELVQALRATFVTISYQSGEMLDAVLQMPIKTGGQINGTIFVGPKLSGDKYTDQDTLLLKTFANQAATAMSRILLYQEVRQRADDLEQKVTERTQELQHTQEKQKEIMLQISHNLQTPLAILQTKIESLKDTITEESAVVQLEHSVQITSQLIHSLLRLARLESGYDQMNFKTCNISEGLLIVAEEMEIIASEKKVLFHTNITPDIEIRCDDNRLREAVLNILSNALKYIGNEGERSITLSLRETASDAIITITDTGIGISEENQKHIFENFYRVPANTKIAGTGLGLTVTKEIITRHNGTLTVDSQLGRGSTFTITLPKPINE